jgi:hypothetical protein
MVLIGLESSNEKLIVFSKFRKRELVKASSLLEGEKGIRFCSLLVCFYPDQCGALIVNVSYLLRRIFDTSDGSAPVYKVMKTHSHAHNG